MTVMESGLRVKAVVTVNSARVIVMTAVMTVMTAIMTVVTAITAITVLLLSRITDEEKPGGRSNFHFKNIEPVLTTKFLIGYFRILMSYKNKKRKDQIKNLFLPFLYPEPGSNRHSIAATGV